MATPLTSVDTGHADMLHDAQLDFYGRRLATCSSDRSIKIFDVSGDEQTLSGEILAHDGPVWQVQWAHPQFGVLLASCSYDRRIMIHKEVSTGNWIRIYTYEGHASSVNSIAWAPYEYGLKLAAASSDGTISILTHKEDDSWTVTRINNCSLGCNSISWAPAAHVGGITYTLPEGAPSPSPIFVKRLAVAGADGKVRIHRGIVNPQTNIEKWEDAQELVMSNSSNQTNTSNGSSSTTPHKEWVRDVAWSPSSGIGGNILVSCSDDGIVAIWTQTVPGDDNTWKADLLPVFQAPVWKVSWSTTGHLLSISCADNNFSLWKQNLDTTWSQVSTVPDPTILSMNNK